MIIFYSFNWRHLFVDESPATTILGKYKIECSTSQCRRFCTTWTSFFTFRAETFQTLGWSRVERINILDEGRIESSTSKCRIFCTIWTSCFTPRPRRSRSWDDWKLKEVASMVALLLWLCPLCAVSVARE